MLREGRGKTSVVNQRMGAPRGGLKERPFIERGAGKKKREAPGQTPTAARKMSRGRELELVGRNEG